MERRPETKDLEERKYCALRPVVDESKSHPVGAPETNLLSPAE
jgi:hypothetical protein